MVIFQTPDGNPGYNQFETLDEAVRFVEKLRNEQSVETARMFALEEVTFDFKPYFRVQLDPPAVTSGSRNDNSATSSASSPSPSSPPPASIQAPTNGQSPYSPPTSAPPAPSTPPVTFGEPPAAPAAPVADIDSPVGNEPAPVGAASPPPPTFMSPPGPATATEGENQTTRRGLFGR
jgi:hypothetical protein